MQGGARGTDCSRRGTLRGQEPCGGSRGSPAFLARGLSQSKAPPAPRACLLNRRKGGLGPAGVPGTSRLAGTPRSDSPELHAWDSLIHFAGGEARRRGQPEPPLPPYPPPCPALTSEADSRLICVGRKKELFPFYFIFITNCVPQT